MTGLERFLRGWALVELRSAAPEHCLNRCCRDGIPFWEVTQADAFTLRLHVFCRDLQRLQETAAITQGEIRICALHSGIRRLRALRRRPCLLITVAVSLFLTLFLQNYVWYIGVSGNEQVPTAEIIRALDDLGVHFGAENADIHSQEIKNHLLNQVEGLQWAAVNCSGGHCQVLVREREAAPELPDRRLPCNVIAAQSGTIVELSVLEGQACCAVGDTVEQGQLLVSGINDFTVNLQKTRAQAEIYARTWRSLTAITPADYVQSGQKREESVCRYLQLGRNRIKISGNSSICTAGCDKIITRNVLTLPLGITLPVVLITETRITAEPVPITMTEAEAEALLLRYGMRRVEACMAAGRILDVRHQTSALRGSYCLEAVFACREMIAQEQEVNLFGSEQFYGRESSERGAD